MRCLVTGGAGFIGSHLVRALLRRGDEVCVLDNLSTGSRANLEGVEADVDLQVADLRDPEVVVRACRGVSVVFHLAALPSVPRSVDDPRASFESNARGTLHVLDAARREGVGRVVYAASSSAYGGTDGLPKREDMVPHPLSPYAADKLHGENLCRAFHAAYGLPSVALRYFNVFGPRQSPDSPYAAVIPRFISAVLEGRPVTVYGDGRQTRDFTYVENAVQANLLAAECGQAGGEAINVGGGTRTSLLELLDRICAACGTRVEPRSGPPRPGDVRDSQADLERARRVLAYEARIGIDEGLALTVAWFRERAQGAAPGSRSK